VKLESHLFLEKAHEALQDADKVERRNLMGLLIPPARQGAVDQFSDFEQLRQHVKSIRQHTLDNLDHYLLEFEEKALENGAGVHFARTSEEMNKLVLEICKTHGASKVAKGKSMVTEETGLNEQLLAAGLSVIETDLGEYIIQQAGETPSHIVGPALHKSQQEIRELFLAKHDLGERELTGVQDMVTEARTVLRQHFLEAEVGIIGSNALIAENGYSLLVTNEGNGDLCANLPDVLIVCTTLDRILPRAQDAMAVQRLLVRSAIGQAITSYTSFYSGPRREDDVDGPVETHFILLDNNRSDILASDYREILECIRCGSCLSHCPVYVGAGGHAYGSVYSGPMGSVLTPLLTSLEESNTLPNACTTCGRCQEVCPADIPLPDLLRDLRSEEVNEKLSPGRWRLGLKVHAWLCSQPRLYQRITGFIIPILNLVSGKRGSFRRLPMAGGWTHTRDFPAPERKTFMQQYRNRMDVADD
jgi:L-lactate dehydrogenase complex protein LldF